MNKIDNLLGFLKEWDDLSAEWQDVTYIRIDSEYIQKLKNLVLLIKDKQDEIYDFILHTEKQLDDL